MRDKEYAVRNVGRRIFQTFSSQGPRMLAKQEEECQELSKVIKHMSERQEKLLALMERKKSLQKEALEDLRKQIFRAVRELDERSPFENCSDSTPSDQSSA